MECVVFVGKIFICTPKTARKVKNIRRNPNKIYFSIDDENYPFKGVNLIPYHQ